MSKYILAIDQGTTGTTAMLVDKNAAVVVKVNKEHKQYYPQPGWVEHEPEEIWQRTLETIALVLMQAGAQGSDIAAIGITNQRETTVLWDRMTGNSVHPAIVWQDRRTAIFCDKLKKTGILPKVRKTTGLVLDPYFSATKIRWLLDNVPHARALAKENKLAFGTIDSFLTFKLTGGKTHVTDVTNASRTLLMNLSCLEWDKDMLKLFGVPPGILPQIKSCSQVYGKIAGVAGLPDGIPIAGMAGDQQAALFGQACFMPGEAKCTYGTGSFLLMNIGKKPVLSKSGLLTTVAWQVGKDVSYALEGSAFIAGAAVQWLRDELKIIDKAADIEALAQSVSDNGGVTFVPALAGLGAPHWNAYARGGLSGLTRGSGRGHIARAVLEGIAFSQFDILAAMQKDAGKKLKILKVDGGAAANNLLMQFQADILGCQIVRPRVIETTGLGAAFLAGLGAGFWQDQKEITAAFKVERIFAPQMKSAERKGYVDAWQKAVRRSLVI